MSSFAMIVFVYMAVDLSGCQFLYDSKIPLPKDNDVWYPLNSFNWCCVKCNGPHVMCRDAIKQHRITKPKGCKQGRMKGTNNVDFSESSLVDLINQARRKFAKNANVSNMQYLRTSDTLTSFAAILAGYCNSIPSPCVDTDKYEVKLLKFNLTISKENVTMPMVVDYWTRGKIPYLEKYHDRFSGNYSTINETDDFTLLMWGATSEIGCAQGYYRSGAPRDETTNWEPLRTNSSSNRNSDFNSTRSPFQGNVPAMSVQITCLLGPAGNVIGLPVWKRGDPCSDCSPTEKWTQEGNQCLDALCYNPYPQWSLDKIRLANCSLDYRSEDHQIDPTERSYVHGVSVLLKPRYICDPISDAATPTTSSLWPVLAVTVLGGIRNVKYQ